jgi:predicted GNAT family acetyltransferase
LHAVGYTPPQLRGRGYAGSVTAAVLERIFTEGKIAACLKAFGTVTLHTFNW